MKIILQSLALLTAASLLLFCKHQPKFTADNLPPQKLLWGSGGGFTGKETSYVLLKNGQIFKREMAGEPVELPKTKSKTAAAIFKTAETLDFSKLESNHPGNIYSFMSWNEGDIVRRIVWGDAAYPANSEVKALFERLNGLLKQ